MASVVHILGTKPVSDIVQWELNGYVLCVLCNNFVTTSFVVFVQVFIYRNVESAKMPYFGWAEHIPWRLLMIWNTFTCFFYY